MKRLLQATTLVILIVLVITACAPAITQNAVPTSTPQASPTQMVSREAQVQSVEIQMTDTTPAQINAIIRGNLSESGATLGKSQVEYASNTFRIKVYTLSPADRGGAPTITPFETTIALNTTEFAEGTYTVIANGVSAVFSLPVESPTATPGPTLTATPTSSACRDSAAFVADVTIPDNSVLVSDTAFTKTWRVKNTGTCTWDSSYLVAYVSSAAMSQQPGYWILPQGQTVAPSQTVDVSVGMTSPVDNGNYVSYWGLKQVDGPFMPIASGANGDSFYVKIKVNNGITLGNVTAASIEIEPEQGSGPACTADSTYFVHASITTNGPATVTYEIDSTAGQTPAGYFQTSNGGDPSLSIPGTWVFDQADTKTIDLRFVGPFPYPDNISILLWVNRRDWYQTKLSCS